jgi:type IV fimbrial biogenesis protein FimT
MHPKPGRGFTIVELMVTVAVLVVLVAIAVPSFNDFFDRHRVRGAAEEVVSVIANARAEAVKNDLDVNIALQGAGDAWCLGANAAAVASGGNPAGVPAACDCSVVAECRISGLRFAVESTDFPDVAISAVPAEMIFDSNMGVLSPLQQHVIGLVSPTGKYDLQVRVNPLGQAHACVPAGSPGISGIRAC